MQQPLKTPSHRPGEAPDTTAAIRDPLRPAGFVIAGWGRSHATPAIDFGCRAHNTIPIGKAFSPRTETGSIGGTTDARSDASSSAPLTQGLGVTRHLRRGTRVLSKDSWEKP